MRKGLAALALVLVGATACGPLPDQGTTPSQAAVTAAKVGQPVKVTGDDGATAEATVLSVTTAAKGQGDLAQPPANGQYSVIDVEIKVTGGTFQVNPLYVRYQAADGKTYDQNTGNSMTAGFSPELTVGGVPNGQSTRGVVAIDTPAGSPKAIQLTNVLGDVIGAWQP
jgi:hypothetical protein